MLGLQQRHANPVSAESAQRDGDVSQGHSICDGGHWSLCFNARPPEQETCDGLDNDCNGVVDDNAVDAQPYYCDRDKDDHIATDAKAVVTCPSNLKDCPGGVWRTFESVENLHDDCDDTDPNRFTGKLEICDGVDNDCDPEHLVDEIREDDGGIIDLKKTYYRDADGDGFGDPHRTKHVCPQQLDGYVEIAGDCDDTRKGVHPTALETCNGVDDDCDGVIDDPPLSDTPQMPGTTFACMNGQWGIVLCPSSVLDCDHDYSNGCETDGTTLANCHACNTGCAFSCGATGCDEIVSISAGNSHTCAVTTAGVAACWGSNELGQIGDEHVANQSAFPIRVAGLPAPVLSIRARADDTCAIAGPASTAYCWGDNGALQCGAIAASEKDTVASPEAVDSAELTSGALTNVSRIDVGGSHTCAVYKGGRLACWGSNLFSAILPQSLFGDSFTRAKPILRQTPDEQGVEVVRRVRCCHRCLSHVHAHPVQEGRVLGFEQLWSDRQRPGDGSVGVATRRGGVE